MAITVERLVAEVEANPEKAIAALAAFDAAAAGAAKDRTANITVDYDRSKLDLAASGARAVGEAIDDTGDSMRSLSQNVGYTLGSVAAGMEDLGKSALGGLRSLRDFGGFLRHLGQTASGAGGSIGGMGGDIGGMGGKAAGASGAIVGFGVAIVKLGAVVAIATAAISALGTIGSMVAGGLQMIAGAAGMLVGTLVPLVGVLGALLPMLGALGGGLGVAIMGFGGVGDAMGAYDQQLGAVSAGGSKAASNAYALADAQNAVKDATRGVTDAQRGLLKAQQAVSDARKEAAKDLKTYARDVRNAVWDEEDAVERLRKAQENLNNVQKKTSSSSVTLLKQTDDFTGKVYETARISSDGATDAATSRRDAERELMKAQQGLTLAQERTAESRATLNDAERKGVEGSDKVQSALERQADAARGVARAQEALARSQESLRRTMEGTAAGAGAGNAAMNKYKDAMAALTPEGRNFVLFLKEEFLPAWKTVTDAAQRGLLPGVQSGLSHLMDAFPAMADKAEAFGKALGGAFDDFMAHFTTPDMINRIDKMFDGLLDVLGGTFDASGNQVQKGLLDMLIPLARILLSITEIATPLAKLLIGDWADGLDATADKLDTVEGKKGVTKFFESTYKFMKLWGKVLGPIPGILGSLAKAAEPLATWLLGAIGDDLEDLGKWMSSDEGQKKMTDWFKNIQPALREVGGLFKDLAVGILDLNQGGEESGFVKVIKAVREDLLPAVLDLIETMDELDVGPGFIKFLADAVRWVDEDFIPTMQKTMDIMKDVHSFVTEDLGPVWTALGVIFSSAWDIIVGVATGAFKILTGLGEIFFVNSETSWKDFGDAIWKILEGTVEILESIFKGLFQMIAGAFGVNKEDSERVWNEMWENIGNSAEEFGLGINDIWTGIYNGFIDALNMIVRAWNNFSIDTPQWMNDLGIPDIATPDIPEVGGKQTSVRDQRAKREKAAEETKASTKYGGGVTSLTARAVGGPVTAGQPYVVGERRAELFIPDVGGRIAPTVPGGFDGGGGITEEQLDRLIQKILDHSKPNVQMEVNNTEKVDPMHLSEDLAWSLR